MQRMTMVLVLMFLAAMAAAEVNDVNANSGLVKVPDTYVLIVSGINKDPEEQQSKDRAVIKLRKFFEKNKKVQSGWLKVMVCESSFAKKGSEISTAANIEKMLSSFAKQVGESDRFIFYYVGQANVVVDKLRINLPGSDITSEELGGWIKQIKASSVLVVLDCPGAGMAIKHLNGPGRIIVCGSRSDQLYSTRFSDYFVPAIDNITSDTDGDLRVSLLEAFTSASMQIDDLYREGDLLKTETPILEDNGDGVPSQQPWRYEKDKNDGATASKFFFSE